MILQATRSLIGARRVALDQAEPEDLASDDEEG
jgi:hypothetical protein